VRAACIAAGFSKPWVRRDGRPRLDRQGRQLLDASLIFHDLRRSAVRNMELNGTPRSIGMKISGHKTESVYRRYAIVTTDDVRRELARVQAATATKAKSNVIAMAR